MMKTAPAVQVFLGLLWTTHPSVRTRSGPGLDDGKRLDVVMMDDFIYGEPQAIQ